MQVVLKDGEKRKKNHYWIEFVKQLEEGIKKMALMPEWKGAEWKLEICYFDPVLCIVDFLTEEKESKTLRVWYRRDILKERMGSSFYSIIKDFREMTVEKRRNILVSRLIGFLGGKNQSAGRIFKL